MAHDARSIAEYCRRANDLEDAVKLVQLYGDLRISEATPRILAEVFGSDTINKISEDVAKIMVPHGN